MIQNHQVHISIYILTYCCCFSIILFLYSLLSKHYSAEMGIRVYFSRVE